MRIKKKGQRKDKAGQYGEEQEVREENWCPNNTVKKREGWTTWE